MVGSLDAECAVASTWWMLQHQLGAMLMVTAITAVRTVFFYVYNVKELLLLLLSCPVAGHQQHLAPHVQQQLDMQHMIIRASSRSTAVAIDVVMIKQKLN
jgi:hypothetical protein